MSARQWRIRLEDCQRQLGDAATAAKEWKLVANNRLTLLHKIDEAFTRNLELLEEVGEIFGVKVALPEDVWEDTSLMDGGTTAMYIMGKIESISIYQKELLKEASSIQVTLNDTFDYACKAVIAARPSRDLVIPDMMSTGQEPSSPLSELADELNNEPSPADQDDISSTAVALVNRPSQDVALKSSALDLFNR